VTRSRHHHEGRQERKGLVRLASHGHRLVLRYRRRRASSRSVGVRRPRTTRTLPIQGSGMGRQGQSKLDGSRTRQLRRGKPRPALVRGFEPLTPCIPCSFGLLLNPKSGVYILPNGPLGVTAIDRWGPLVTAAYGTWMARPARTTVIPPCDDSSQLCRGRGTSCSCSELRHSGPQVQGCPYR
jgi:hypothetical protein